MPPSLPEFIPPMLATLGQPFDSDEHLFEVKWDGMRCIAFRDDGGVRAFSRNRVPMLPRFPELELVAAVEPGIVLDGEIILLTDGKPDFRALMGREHARGRMKIQALSRSRPVTYVVFDLLYRGYESLMKEPLATRRDRLGEVVDRAGSPGLVVSDGIVGRGTAFFEQVTSRGIEGVVAKRLDDPYRPGRRTRSWTKFKAAAEIHCVILGFSVEDGDLRSLVIAAEENGRLRSVGRVGGGMSDEVRKELLARLERIPRAEPVIDCSTDANWVEPELFCRVRYLERTPDGNLRAPVFVDLVTPSS